MKPRFTAESAAWAKARREEHRRRRKYELKSPPLWSGHRDPLAERTDSPDERYQHTYGCRCAYSCGRCCK